MPILALFALAAVSGATVRPVRIDDFQWRRALAAGKTIEIVGINGSIDASGTGGREVDVVAVKKGRRSDPETVRIEVVEHAGGVTICAVYPSARNGEENECRVETSSFANATTVNGSLDARVGSADWRGDAEFEAVNGSITVDLPASANMEVDASTVNGSMSTDFPLTIRGKWGPQRMSGTIGQGGRTLSLSTVNGSMSLRRTQ